MEYLIANLCKHFKFQCLKAFCVAMNFRTGERRMESKSKSTEFGHNPQFKNKIFLIRSFLSKPNPSTSKCNSKSAKKQQIDKFIWNHSINQFWYRMPMAKLHQSLIVQACVLQFNVSKSSELILYIKRANKIKAINSLVFFGFWKVDLNQRYSLIFCCFDFWKYEFCTQRNDSKYIIKYSKWTWCSA